MSLTVHADKRSQQRGIAPMVIDLLLEFGSRRHDGHGAEICFFDRRAKKKVQAYTGGLMGRLSDELDAYVVVAGERIITAGTRYRKLNNR
jgi:hypothetical protein